MADFSLNVKINGADQVITTVGQIEQALVATREELKNVAIGSDAFQDLSTQAQTLQREFVNSYKETTNFQKGIAELGQSVGSVASTITAGFTIATSAFALFGEEGTAVSEAAQKAQLALALALSATTIATNAKTLAEDLSNISSALGLNILSAKTAAQVVNNEVTATSNILTVGSAVAAGADAAAKTAETAATGAATVAQEGLNVAMAANPIGLLIAGVAALVAGLIIFSDSEETAESKTAETNKTLLEQSDLVRKQSDDFISVYKTRREIAILEEKDANKKLQMQKDLDAEILGLQKDAVDVQLESVTKANAKSIADFEQYKSAFTTIKQELVGVTTEYDEFGVSLGQSEQYRDVEVKLGQSRLDNLKTQLKDRITEIETSAKYEKTTQDEKNLLIEQAQSKYYIDYLTAQKSFLAQSTQADDEQKAKNLANLIDSFKQVRAQLEKALAEQLKIQADADKKAADDKAKSDADAAKKLADDLEKRRQAYRAAYKEIRKEVNDVLKELNDLEIGYTDELNKTKFKTKGEEVAFELSLEQRKLDDINKLKRKEIEDSKVLGKEKNGLLLKFDTELKQTQDALNNFYKAKKDAADAEDLKLAQDKADKIAIIEKVLKDEISFGDQNTADYKETLTLRENQLKIEQLDFEKSLNNMRIKDFEEYEAKRLELIKQNLLIKRDADLKDAEATALRDLTNFKDNLQKEFGVEFTETAKGKELLDKFKTNGEEQLNVKKKEINQKYRQDDANADKKSADETLSYRLQQLQKYADLAAQIANTILGLATAITEGNKIESENQLRDLRDSVANQTSALNEGYNAQKASLQERLDAGVISQEQYNSQISALDKGLADSTDKLNKDYRAKELAEKKKAFESDKKLKIAQAIISGLQGAISAFTGAFQLGPIAGPIVGAILAALVAGTTAVQISNIKKTQFDGGAPQITAPNTGGASSETSAAITNASSSGGFTGFNQGLVGTPTGTGAQFSPITPQSSQRVYVVESDITNAQRRVYTLESNASFG